MNLYRGSRRAYAAPIIVFICSVVLIVIQLLGWQPTLAERVSWLAGSGLLAVGCCYWVSSARVWSRFYDSIYASYEQCSASRDYWMEAAQANGELAWREEPDP